MTTPENQYAYQADPQAPYQPEPETHSAPPGTANMSDVERMIQQALDRQDRQHRQEMDDLRAELSSQQAPARVTTITDHPVPWHAGGPGGEIAETWSAYDQDLANRGEHPLQSETQESEQVA